MFHQNFRSIAIVGALCCALVAPELADAQGKPGEKPAKSPVSQETPAPQGGGDTGVVEVQGGVPGEQGGVPASDSPAGDAAVPEIPPVDSNAGKAPPPGAWFKKIHIDFGKHVESSKALRFKGEYAFKNTSGADQKVTIVTSSCKCQELEFFVGGKKQSLEKKTTIDEKLKAPISIPKDAEGVIKLVFDVSGSAGARSGHIRVDTSDAKMPTLNLTCAAVIDPAFVVEPMEIQVGEMAPTESKKWTAKVRCMLPGEWKLEEKPLQPVAAGMFVDSVERRKDETGEFYEIQGRYGPGLEEGAIGGNLLFKTSRDDRNVLLSIRASVRERVKINRSFVSFNRFQRSKGASKTVYVWPSDTMSGSVAVDRVEVVRGTHKEGGVEFEIVPPKAAAEGQEKMFEIPGMQVSVPKGKLWRVILRAKPGIQLKAGRRLSVLAKIHFKGKDSVAKTIRFNGFPAGD